jgi:hypothetical protein
MNGIYDIINYNYTQKSYHFFGLAKVDITITIIEGSYFVISNL